MLVYGECECFVMQMLYVCVLCTSVAVLNAAFCMTCSLLMMVDNNNNILLHQFSAIAIENCKTFIINLIKTI